MTNDIYTTEDADFLSGPGVLDPERILAVETGCCPHTAIRDDIAANLEAIERLNGALPGRGAGLVESGGDNLTATFSRVWSSGRCSSSTWPAATRFPERAARV